jgi:L-ribulokinase
MTLATKPAEMYRALIESTAFGARVIAERFGQYGIDVERIINCGGISAKNPMVMQIYCDVMGRPLEISRSDQSCALGSAMSGAVVAGRYESFDEAGKDMTGVQGQRFTPNPDNRKVYDQLYALYKRMHDAFGIEGADADLYGVMRDLLAIGENVKA